MCQREFFRELVQFNGTTDSLYDLAWKVEKKEDLSFVLQDKYLGAQIL